MRHLCLGFKTQIIKEKNKHGQENVALLEMSLLKNYAKLQVCLPKIGRVYTKKVATEKHRFAANKEA